MRLAAIFAILLSAQTTATELLLGASEESVSRSGSHNKVVQHAGLVDDRQQPLLYLQSA